MKIYRNQVTVVCFTGFYKLNINLFNFLIATKSQISTIVEIGGDSDQSDLLATSMASGSTVQSESVEVVVTQPSRSPQLCLIFSQVLVKPRNSTGWLPRFTKLSDIHCNIVKSTFSDLDVRGLRVFNLFHHSFLLSFRHCSDSLSKLC